MNTTLPKGIFQTDTSIILASGSPRRQAMLASQGLCFKVIPASLKEPPINNTESPIQYALRLASLKAGDIATRFPSEVIIGADTIVVHDDLVLGKPKTRKHALEMLMMLNNREHQVITGVSILQKNTKFEKKIAISTDVQFGNFGSDTLRAYVDTGEPADKAGAYAIQGVGAFLVKSISGSYSNVVGLPLTEVIDVLLERGIIVTGSDDNIGA